MPNILVLGSQGMLGQTVSAYLAGRGCNVTGTQFADPSAPNFLDACDCRESWKPAFSQSRCEYVVNCIGVLKPGIHRERAGSLRTAIRVNSLFPHEVADIAAEMGAKVIHISTDGVFAGSKSEPYTELDVPDCRDDYGRTKVLGESQAPNVLNIRCSVVGLDGVKHKGLLEWLIQQPEDAYVRGFSDQCWNGVTTLQFARLCEALMLPGAFDGAREEASIHHFCPNPALTKYNLLLTWARTAGSRVQVRPSDSGDSGGSRLLATIQTTLPSLVVSTGAWPEILAELISFESNRL